jgi:peptidoglycan/LPS O-acetylase OafA/YrhL
MARSKILDILRAVAVIAVLGRHMEICPQDTNRYLNNLTYIWQQGGWVGVDLFFVLSGFLISGLLFREHQKHGYISFKRFFTSTTTRLQFHRC